jgi:predicted DNA-binding mobile mystery protein A
MKNKYLLKLNQVEDAVQPLRKVLGAQPPHGGWIRAIREALGMSSAQLAKRLKFKASQSVEDMQRYELSGSISLKSLDKVARALDCRLVYALVPLKPLEQVRQERATEIARQQLRQVAHSMALEAQRVGVTEEQRELDALVQELLAGNPRRLWD